MKNNSMNPRRNAFTLVELLVVITVIALLVSLLLPALGKSRAQALRLQDSANIRSQIQGYIAYATDRRNELPQIRFTLGSEPVWYVIGWDFRPIFNDYGTMAATANPILGTPALDNPGNTYSQLALPWYYLCGTPAVVWDCTVPGFESASALAPTRLDLGTSRHVMVQDQLGGSQVTSEFWCTLAKNTSYQSAPLSYVPNNPSHAVISVPTAADALGVYAGTFDGAVTLRKVEDARWAGYFFGNTTQYIIAHYQPE